MNFVENLTFSRFLKVFVEKGELYYGKMTMPAQILERILSLLLRRSINFSSFRMLESGGTEFEGGAVQRAGMNARARYEETCGRYARFLQRMECAFGIDFPMVFKKYIISRVLYPKYHFYELVMQYIEEHPEDEHRLWLDPRDAEPYLDTLRQRCQIHTRSGWNILSAVLALVGIPVLLLYWYMRSRRCAPRVDSQLICLLSTPQNLSIYRDLFGEGLHPAFATTPEYWHAFHSLPEKIVICLSLSRNAFRHLARCTCLYWFGLAIHAWSLRHLGEHPLLLLHEVYKGRAKTPDGVRHVVVVSEHHDLSKFIRNEFLRMQGSRSLFFPLMAVLWGYPEEFFENYDSACLVGSHNLDEFRYNEARIGRLYEAGQYFYHDRLRAVTTPRDVSALREFKGGDVLVTILCPGVCKPTYHSEIKLMDLAKELSMLPGVKVAIRRKPVILRSEYTGFYDRYTEGNPSMLLTHMEYGLFDFLPVTDLFVTTYSTSACEVATCGGSIFFVDTLRQPERFAFWSPDVVGGLLLDIAQARDTIVQWLHADPQGAIRRTYREDLQRFVDYIAYRHADFDEYKSIVSEAVSYLIREMSPSAEHGGGARHEHMESPYV